jgi:hypothetical protein
VLIQQWASLPNSGGDRPSVHIEQLAQDCLCAESAQVEDSGEDAVGVVEFDDASCPRGAAAGRAATFPPTVFTSRRLGFGQIGGDGVELLSWLWGS